MRKKTTNLTSEMVNGSTSSASLTMPLQVEMRKLEAAVVANAAAGVVVSKVGTATATPEEIVELLPKAVSAARASRRPS